MVHATALFRSSPDNSWKVVGTGCGATLKWAAGACFICTYGTGITYTEVPASSSPTGTEARITRTNKDGHPIAEWRVIPSPGSVIDNGATDPKPVVAVAPRARRGASSEPARAPQGPTLAMSSPIVTSSGITYQTVGNTVRRRITDVKTSSTITRRRLQRGNLDT